MNKNLNRLFVIIYWLLISLPLVYAIVSAFSYYAIIDSLEKLGLEPINIYDGEVLFKRNLHIIPIDIVFYLVEITIIAYCFAPVFILTNFSISRFSKNSIHFQKHLNLVLIEVYLVVFYLLRFAPIGWYYRDFID